MFRLVEETAGTKYYINGENLSFEENELTATYYTSVKDIGYICEAKIMIDFIASIAQSMAWNSDPLRAFDDDPLLRFTGAETPGLLSFEIRVSKDNITWGDWEEWISADYNCRYFQIRMIMVRESLAANINVSNFIIKVDLPDVDEIIEDTVSIAADGAAVTFIKTYHEIPSINVDIISGDGFVNKFSVAPTITGCTVKLYDLDGIAVVGDFRMHVHGI